MARSQSLATAAALAATAAIVLSGLLYRRKCCRLTSRVRELEASLAAATEKASAERRGRVRAQQSLRKALSEREPRPDEGMLPKAPAAASYPMAPIGTVQSCFSTRNGTPRQPLVVPLARAIVALDPARVPVGALEGLASYSHCWILYVFHLNTDLDKMWKDPARSKVKAKPVLDIKPYLPYSDSVKGAAIPDWLEVDSALAVGSISYTEHFISALSNCWMHTQDQSLYATADEFQDLIKEVLSWDIRSLSQRIRPHQVISGSDENAHRGKELDEEYHEDRVVSSVVYHLHLEGIDVSYRIDQDSNIVVEDAALLRGVANQNRHSYLAWKDKLRSIS